MEWLTENWVLVLVFGSMAGMYLFGHGHGKKHSPKYVPIPKEGSEDKSASHT